MTKAMRAILSALSYENVDVEAARKLGALKKLDPMRIFYRKLDTEIYNEDYKVPIRLYFPSEKVMEAEKDERAAILFFHGGGWTTESVENYDRVCARMSQSTGQIVASVEYRLAPEHKFPTGLMDCYAAAKALYTKAFLPDVPPERITVMGDSAGGNLAAAVCMMARDRKDFFPRKQILIYPALNNSYTEESRFPSVRENGEGYLLTSRRMENYLELYQRDVRDRSNPYFAPIIAEDFTGLPDTLILTAQYDPLRDEGEAYGKLLADAGNYVEVRRIAGALHGYFALGIEHLHVQESFKYMNHFLKGEEEDAESKASAVEKIR